MKKLIALLLGMSMLMSVCTSALDAWIGDKHYKIGEEQNDEQYDETDDAGNGEYDNEDYIDIPFEEEFEYEFDKASGTFIRMISDEDYMYVPMEIEGVSVKRILPGAFTDKQNVTWADIDVPEAMEGAVFVNCPNLETLGFFGGDFLELPYENCPKLDEFLIDGEEGEADLVEAEFPDGAVKNPRELMKKLGVFKGNGKEKNDMSLIFGIQIKSDDSEMEWDKTLTRAEAVITVLRLMGKEEDAKKETGYSAFSDVPDWAVSYVNYAYKNGIVKGVSEDRFDPYAPCGAKDYCVMLLRLTDLKENTDYSWATALRDMRSAIGEGTGWHPRGGINYDEKTLFAWICLKGFTRKYAASLIYGFLSVPFADGKTTYGDVLCEERSMTTREMAGCGIRLSDKLINREMFPSYTYKPGDEVRLNSYLYYGSESEKFEELNTRTVIINTEIKAKAEELTKGLTDDYAKAKAISKWICENIKYDYDKYEKIKNHDYPRGVVVGASLEDIKSELERKDAEDALLTFKTKKGVCDDYSMLTREMLAAVGVKSVYLSGYGNSDSHAWNEAYIDGRWFPIDNTWGMKYFDMDPEKFYEGHTPDFGFDNAEYLN